MTLSSLSYFRITTFSEPTTLVKSDRNTRWERKSDRNTCWERQSDRNTSWGALDDGDVTVVASTTAVVLTDDAKKM